MNTSKQIMASYFLEEIKEDKFSEDPDNTKAAWDFYSEYWGELLDGNNNYRGDTIISFNTIAGALIRMTSKYKENKFLIYENENDVDGDRLKYIINLKDSFVSDKLKKDFQEFHRLYHSLANFMPLVKTEEAFNLNHIRYSEYQDFPEGFLRDVQKYYNGLESNEHFQTKINADYFKKFETWEKFVEMNYLQSFFKKGDLSYEDPIQLKPISDDFPYKAEPVKKLREENRKNYCKRNVEQIEDFLSKAIQIIKNRSEDLSKVNVSNKR